MMRTQADQAGGKFTGRHMLIIMLVFFMVIISVNITMAVLASRSWTGLVVKNSYVASQHFNEELRAAREQKKRGWQSALQYSPNDVRLSLRDRQNQAVMLNDMVLKWGRPAFEQADQSTVLHHIGDGVYRAPVTLAAGLWALRITGGKGAHRYRRDSRIRISADGKSGLEE